MPEQAFFDRAFALCPESRVWRARAGLVFFLIWTVVGLLYTPQALAAARENRFSVPFTRIANQEPLNAVLLDFAQTQGYGAVISPSVEGVISGTFEAVPPGKFLNGIRGAFGVSWYTLDNTIYFYPEAQSTRMFISPKATPPMELYQSLRLSGVLSPELPSQFAPGGKMIIVSGPPSYLEEVRAAVAAFEETLTANIVMKVFPLKYAWADDITVTSMDTTVTVPGIASILRAAISRDNQTTTTVTEKSARMEGLLGSGLAKQGSDPVAPTPKAVLPSGKQMGTNYANIMADPRVNAVLVTDAAYRMPQYEKAIAELDKPVELVEIHAAIVDIDVNYSRELGVSYQGRKDYGYNWGGAGSLAPEGQTLGPALPTTLSTGPGLDVSTIYSYGAEYFIARVRALEEQGEARMLGRPSVLTVDNVQATLENTSTYYIKVEGYQATDLFKIDAGTVLRVTPHIITNPDKAETIKLAVTVQDNQNKDTTITTGSVPLIKQTKINTQAIVGAGQSLLIGGYFYEEARDTDSGVPILMSIPVLGHLFKNAKAGTRRMERLILISPRVIKLNDLPSIPSRVDEKSFQIDPTQPTYETRQVVARPAKGGCSGRAASLDPAKAATPE